MNNNGIQPRNLNAELYDAVNADEMMRSAKFDLISELVRLGANPNLAVDNEPLLFKVMRDEDLPLVQLLIGLGADITSYDAEGYSLLTRSIADDNSECFEFLLSLKGQNNVPLVNVNAFDRRNRTPLMAAALHGNIQAMGRLLELGADPLLMGPRTFSLLHYAARGGHVEAVRHVLNLLNPRTRLAFFNINMQTSSGTTPIMTAIERSHLEALREMMSGRYGRIDNTLVAGDPGWSPLHYAAFAGRKDIIELLNSVGCPINARDKHGRTPIMCAAIAGSYEAVIRLIELEADVTIADSNDLTALHLVLEGYNAHSATKLAIMRALILEGVSVTLNDARGRSALSLAHEYDGRQVHTIYNRNHIRLEPQLLVWARDYLLTYSNQINSIALSLRRQTEQKGVRTIMVDVSPKTKDQSVHTVNATQARLVMARPRVPVAVGNGAHSTPPLITAAMATAAAPGRAS